MERFERDRLARRQKYAASRFDAKDHTDVVRKLETDGFAILPGAADREILLQPRRVVAKVEWHAGELSVAGDGLSASLVLGCMVAAHPAG